MSGTVAFVSGIVLSALFVLSWLGAMLYLRRMRKAMQATTGHQIPHPRQSDPTAPAAPSVTAGTRNASGYGTPGSAGTGGTGAAGGSGTGEALRRTGDEVHSIEDWLARAAALPEGRRPRPPDGPERDQTKLERLAERHFPHLAVPHPHLHLIGLTGLEKRLLAWVSHHTGLPNPFDALERVTGDPDELERATKAWQAAHKDVAAVVDQLCTATARLHERWSGPAADRFYPLLARYLTELDDLAADVETTARTLQGLQAEAALAEGAIAGLVNLLVGSFGGYLVETVLSAGAMTPAVAAQAQVELTWVLKQIALVLARLQSIYANTRHVLESVGGFKGLGQVRERFQIDVLRQIERAVNPAR